MLKINLKNNRQQKTTNLTLNRKTTKVLLKMCDLKKSIKTKCTNTGNGSDELFVNSIKSKCGGSDK